MHQCHWLRPAGEWLEAKLGQVEKWWSNIRRNSAAQELEAAIEDVGQKDVPTAGCTQPRFPTRAAAWLYGQEGVVDKIQRDIFMAGAAKLQLDGVDGNQEYVEFVRSLRPEELQRVQDDTWQ